MHETALARSLLDLVTAEAEKQSARPVMVRLRCSQFDAVNEEVLSFAFRAAAEGTVCESAELRLNRTPVKARCCQCGKEFDFDIAVYACPHCSGEHFDLLKPEPLIVETIEFETE